MKDTKWWLDESALPDYYWARVMACLDGYSVLTLDGVLNIFDTHEAASLWLREDEYELLDLLKEEKRVPIKLEPPKGKDNDELIKNMRVFN